MTKILTRHVLHPFFMAVYPILYLLSYNIKQIPPEQAVRPLLISLSLALVLTILLGISAKNFEQGGLSTTIILALFFTYGHAYNWLEINTPALASHILLGVVWLLFLTAGLALKYRIRDIGSMTKYLNIISLALLIQPIINIGRFIFLSGSVRDIASPPIFENTTPNPQSDKKQPDIYYIILDAYGRSDVVQELFEYDNSAFINFLEQRGFYVADQSRSNYTHTALSLASSLNLDYLAFTEEPILQSGDRGPLAELIHHSELLKFLEEQGYQTITFSTGYDPTTITDSDRFIPIAVSPVNDLEALILSTSVTRALDGYILKIPLLCNARRDAVHSTFENLKKFPKLPGPKFVFAHIISPHPPFVFNANGEAIQLGNCDMFDGNLFSGSFEDYHTGYPQQLAYINKLVQDAVSTILAESQIPPVIIIQGDHGSGLFLDWETSSNSCLHERTAILNAYYIPEPYAAAFYESITPVNSFRVVLNTVFDLQLPLLEDKSYYSTREKPYQLEDITTKIEPSCEPWEPSQE